MTKRFAAIVLVCGVFAPTRQIQAAPGVIERARDRVPNAYIVVLDAATPARENADALTRRAGVKLGHVYDVVMNGFSVRGTEQQALMLSKVPVLSPCGRSRGSIRPT